MYITKMSPTVETKPLLLSEKVRQITCYWRTVVRSNHVTNVIYTKNKPLEQLVSPTKK